MVKYPEITVQLSGEDGNVFSIMGRMSKALRKAGVNQDEINEFQTKAMSGDYDAVLRLCVETVNVL